MTVSGCALAIFGGLMLVVATAGCQAPLQPARDSGHARWIARQGGLETGAAAERVEAAGQRLRPHLPEGMGVRFCVVKSDQTNAWSWPDGTICLASGLVDRLDEEELLAVLAHEAGHLIDARASRSSRHDCHFTLTHGPHLAAEVRADQIGCQLLERCGLDGQPMLRMLRKLKQADDTSAPERAALGRRIEAL